MVKNKVKRIEITKMNKKVALVLELNKNIKI